MREPRPDWSSLGVNFNILDEHPHLFLYLSLRARIMQAMPHKQKSLEQPGKTPEQNGVCTEVFFVSGS